MSRIPDRNCHICGSKIDPSNDALCISHGRASENIQSAFPIWKRAYANLTYPQFLERLSKLPQVGIRTKEMAKFLLSHRRGEDIEDPNRL